MPTIAGHTYTFDFVYSARPGVAAASNTVDIVVNGVVVVALALAALGASTRKRA